MAELIAVFIITVMAVISPGADFAMVTRNSYLFGRQNGLLAAFGVALGVQVHVIYTMLGVGLIISHTPSLFIAIKLAGAAYLIYIGLKTFLDRSKLDIDLSPTARINAWEALRTGFLTNVLNPKTTLFVVATYTQVVNSSTPVIVQIGYGFFMSFAHWVWFSLAALFFSHSRLRSRMIRAQVLLNKVIGSTLIGLGLALAFVPAST